MIQHAPAVSQQVRDGDVDIGVALAAAPAPGVQVLFRTGVDLRAVCAPRHAIASRKSVPLAELQRHQIALPVSTTDARRVFDAACALEGVVIEPVLTANMFAVLVAFVLAGDAVSIMSEVSVRGRVESGQLVAIPIRSSHNLMRCIEIQVMAGRRLPDVAQKFIELLIAELERAV